MATLYSIMSALQQAAASVTGGIVVNSEAITVQSGVGWPSVKRLQDVARQGSNLALISVYDRKVGRDVTRWAPSMTASTITAAEVTTTLSSAVLYSLGSASLTISGTPAVGDGVSLVANARWGGNISAGAQIVRAVSGDTATTLATKLAAAINADPILSTWMTATASGAVVTLENITTNISPTLQSFTGNGGTATYEVARQERQIQIVVWTRTENIRQAVSDPIAGLLASLQATYGPTLSDGTAVRLRNENDYYLEDDTVQDVYRRDFLVRIEYPVTNTDALYAILAPVVDVVTTS